MKGKLIFWVAMGWLGLALPDVDSVLRAIGAGQVVAGVYDAPILQYNLRGRPNLQLLPGVFERRDYALALPLASPLRKSINIAILEHTQRDLWSLRVERYLGTP